MAFNYHHRQITGFTLIELVVTVTIVAILGSAIFPMMQLNIKRAKESELRADLRQMREAIDVYKKAVDDGKIKKSIEQSGYPPNLEVLVNGINDEKNFNKKKIKFLRRIPVDPMRDSVANNRIDAADGWGLRSYQSEASNPSSGDDVYDIYSLSNGIGINGIPYAQW
ncbi:MAG: type II secretion system protein [Methylophilaceae bacterium]|nr:type II secretion system protein [Methylophilaceae bacterium]